MDYAYKLYSTLLIHVAANLRENSWEFGILRAMGLPGKKVVRIYIYEAETIVLACIVQGLMIGCLTAVILTLQFNLFLEMPFKFYINLPVTIVLLASSIVVSFLGSYIPSIKMKKEVSMYRNGQD